MSKLKSKLAVEGPDPKVPPDVRQALTAFPTVNAKWNDLTPIARRDFLNWIDSAKQAETRQRRIERACSMLVAGKRRPCPIGTVRTGFERDLGSFLTFSKLSKSRPTGCSTWGG